MQPQLPVGRQRRQLELAAPHQKAHVDDGLHGSGAVEVLLGAQEGVEHGRIDRQVALCPAKQVRSLLLEKFAQQNGAPDQVTAVGVGLSACGSVESRNVYIAAEPAEKIRALHQLEVLSSLRAGAIRVAA